MFNRKIVRGTSLNCLEREEKENSNIDYGNHEDNFKCPFEPGWVVNFGEGKAAHDGATGWGDEVHETVRSDYGHCGDFSIVAKLSGKRGDDRSREGSKTGGGWNEDREEGMEAVV